MRFKQLELVRYGGFADRLLDFGDGTTDLHLVVGPNEAGKSTLLAAIGDLLFGIPTQSAQNWRFDYSDLRVRARMMTAAGELDLTRRKGKKNTLLGPDGTALPDDLLAPLLNGMDRRSFERMFGLDHAKLREGGEAILEGKDDAARIVLEAGTGFAGIGQNLKTLDELAGSLFKPSAQIPPVNRLMRERAEALALVRSQTLADAQWVAMRTRREEAEASRAALVAEGRALAQRAHAIERLNRVRPLLARQAAEQAGRSKLGQIPPLPLDAGEQLGAARLDRRTALELRDLEGTKRDRAQAQSASIALSASLLAARAEIETLYAVLPVAQKASRDLLAGRGQQAALLERLAQMRQEAGLDATHPIPATGVRKRAREMLQVGRRLEQDHLTLHQNRRAIEAETASLPPVEDDSAAEGLAEQLRLVVEAIPTDASARLLALRAARERADRALAKAMAGLAPWEGTIETLASAVPPGPAETLAAVSATDGARAEIRVAQGEMLALEKEQISLRSDLAALLHGDSLPTPELVAAARAARDELLGEVRAQLGGKSRRQDRDIGAALQAATGHADRLADGRDADAGRIAEHRLLSQRSAEVDERMALAARHIGLETARLETLIDDWSALLGPLGFGRPVPPGDFEGWRGARIQTLKFAEEQDAATQALETFSSDVAERHRQLAQQLADCGVAMMEDDAWDERIALARRQIATLEAGVRARAIVADKRKRIEDAQQKWTMSEQDFLARQRLFEADRIRLLGECGLPGHWSADGIADALEAFEDMVLDGATSAALDRQIALDQQVVDDFDRDFDALAHHLGEGRTDRRFERLHALRDELTSAISAQSLLTRLKDDAHKAGEAMMALDQRLGLSEQVIAQLMQRADVEEETALEAMIEACRLARMHDAELLRLDAELQAQCEGLELIVVAREAEALAPDEAAAELEAIRIRREEIEEARETIGRDLAAAEAEMDSAATATGAADAQQDAVAIGAAMADAAERHVEAASAAALLRWVIDRHRATAQAPLIKKAGALFSQVTAGAFQGLALDYDDEDRPMIRGVRSDGARVGVEGMSEGTRDQLYLALRLAAIGLREGDQILPVICDDLLITADDGRAAEMLRVLAAASRHNQIILFSHHDHIIDVARTALGVDGFCLHRIDRLETQAVGA